MLSILDFGVGGDKIDVSALGISEFESLRLVLTSNANGDASILLNSGIVLRGVDVTSLDADDFIFNTKLVDRTIQGQGLVFGGAGNDTIFGKGTLIGGSGNDTITSDGSSNDILDGGTGIDRLTGADGNDIYYVDNALDIVVETGNYDVDTVNALTSYTLGAGVRVENFVAASSAAIILTGNEFAQTITGNDVANTLYGMDGNDTMHGGAGNDRLFGGLGKDTLTGGVGRDAFAFNTAAGASNFDTITDFV
ncbi:calcium-binding protein, partial [Salmonella enterica subsp. enterica]|nr:calcium-binding protein [Salmonella enterica subsp. enterica serovar Enteritidis]